MYCVARQRDDNAPHDHADHKAARQSRALMTEEYHHEPTSGTTRHFTGGGGFGEPPTFTEKFIGKH